VGPTAWDPCGYDDSIIHKFGIEYDDKLRAYAFTQQRGQTQEFDTTVLLEQDRYRECTSRIQSLPMNVGANCQLHDTKAIELTDTTFAQVPDEGIESSRFECVEDCEVDGTLCDAYRIIGNISCGSLKTQKVLSVNADNLGEPYQILVYNLSEDCIPSPGPCERTSGESISPCRLIEVNRMDCCGWKAVCIPPAGLVELCSLETAERNVPYQCLIGTWNSDLYLWCYDDAATVYAIDHRKGAPHAEEGWKGLYQAMPSTNPDHGGTIYVCVSLDCELPEEGCNDCEES
jgi:hypothetical protein